MRIAFDIGGVLSAHPAFFRTMIDKLIAGGAEIFVITDMHETNKMIEMLSLNGFVPLIKSYNIYSADYKRHGNACKAVLLKILRIDLFFDDFIGYTVWPFAEPGPIRMLMMPDAYRPYYHPDWKGVDGDFGRSCYLGQYPGTNNHASGD